MVSCIEINICTKYFLMIVIGNFITTLVIGFEVFQFENRTTRKQTRFHKSVLKLGNFVGTVSAAAKNELFFFS